VSFQTGLLAGGSDVRAFALLFIFLAVALVAALVVLGFIVIYRAYGRAGKVRRPPARPIEPPELVLARRFAAGEIDEDEYRRRLDALKVRATPPPN